MPKASSSSQLRHTPSDLEIDSLHLESHDEQPPSPKTAALLRRRKNADAQAAFRQRRANYIANLEETVTSLEGAVRRLQDALRDARDESKDLKDENKRLMSIIDAANLDGRQRWDPTNNHPSPLADNLRPAFSHSSLSNSPSLRASPNHGPEFALAYATGIVPSSKSPNSNDLSQQHEPYTPYGSYPSGSRSADQSTLFQHESFPQSASLSEFLTSSAPQATRQMPLEAQSPFDFSAHRPASAAGSDSSIQHSSLFPHDIADALSDHSSLSEPGPSVPQPPLNLGFNDLSLFSGSITSLPMDYPNDPTRASSSTAAWDPAFYSASTFGPNPPANEPEQGETELGRSDTVKASHYQGLNRNNSRGSHRRAFSSADIEPTSQQMQNQFKTEAYLDDTPAMYDLTYGQSPHSRPSSSASSGVSNSGDIGHYTMTSPSGLTRSRSRRHSFPASMSSPGDVDPADSSEDQDMETYDGSYVGLQGSSRGEASALAAAAAAASADPGMSNTLAVIKAQAFGTVRKSRLRAKRPGADSAARVAMEALQARGLGLGLHDVDLDSNPGSKRSRRGRKEEGSR